MGDAANAGPSLNIDFETRSTVDLRKTGVYPYAEHESTDIWCMAWAIGEMEPELWAPSHTRPAFTKSLVGETFNEVPTPIIDHVQAGGEIRAFNAQFERIIWWLILSRRYDFPRPELAQFVDTAAEAAALALPRSLDKAAQAMGVAEQKDGGGRRLMLQMAKPRKPRKSQDEDPEGVYWWDGREDKLAALYEYCRQDVRTERSLAKRLRPLGDYERELYLLDQKMNDRGILIDVPLVDAAQEVVDVVEADVNRELCELTGGKIDAVTNTNAMRDFLDVDSVAKDLVRDMLDGDELDELDRAVLQIRQDAGKSSTSKLDGMRRYACSDDRARGLLRYHGASTGRWAGQGAQPHNYPRPDIDHIEDLIPVMMMGDRDRVEAEAGEPAMHVVSSMLRSMFRAAPGHRFVGGDFSQVEARVLAWIAEQADLVKLFAAGGKVYEDMASTIFGIPVDKISKDSFERQVGKNTELGCGFQMGPDTFAAQVKTQTGLDLSEEHALKKVDGDWHCPNCLERWAGKPTSRCLALPIRAVDAYRTKRHRVKSFWYEINDAAIRAAREPGVVTEVGRGGAIQWTVRGQFLWCVLPSKRPLAYAKPRVVRHTVKPKRGDPFETTSVSFMGVDGYSRKWRRVHGYGGLFTENVVQAMARDLIAAAMLRLEEAGYRPLLSVHDEVLSEPELGHGDLDEYLDLMRVLPRWAKGLPVEAEGWEGERYRK